MRLALPDLRRAPVGAPECFQNYMILYAMLIQTFHLFHILLQIKN
jgi:hypothetical protein